MLSDQNDIRNLQEKIQAAKKSSSPDAPNNPKPIGKIMKVVVEIVAAMAVGLGIGILADNYFETRPLFIIIFFLLGSAAGILNVFRVAKSLQNN